MHSHLYIKVKGKDDKYHGLALKQDFSMSVEDQNPMFHETDMFTYPVEIPLDGNRGLLYNIDDPQSDLRPVSFEHLPARIVVDGLPFRSGTLVMSDDEEVADSLSMNIDANEHSFQDLIGDLKCRDIPLDDDILIGEKIGNVKANVTYDYHVHVKYKGKKSDGDWYWYNRTTEGSCDPQALGFSYPGKCKVTGSKQQAVRKSTRTYPNGHSVVVPELETSYINTANTYADGAKYCNARVCYRHHALSDDGGTSDEIVPKEKSKNQWEDKSPYWVLDADRQQSGICFYVLYFLDKLFDYLGVSFDKSALLAVGDFSRLCFFTTRCKYDQKVIHGTITSVDANGNDVYTDADTGASKSAYTAFLSNNDQIQAWLDSRGCGGSLVVENTESKSVTSATVFDIKNNSTQSVEVGKNDVEEITISTTVKSSSMTADIMGMYANADNLPDESVKTVLDDLENAFGIRFNFDYEKKRVTAYLIRDVFRNDDAPIDFRGQVISMHKVSEKITGFSMKYNAESDDKEQTNNVKNKRTDYDTTYDYIDYPKDHTVINKTYTDFFKELSAGDMNCYIDQRTGNAYRIKVDKEATQAKDLQPRLFEVGQFHGVELGDCSALNSDFIEEHTISFTPMEFNDVNYLDELDYVNAYGKQMVDSTGQYRVSDINVNSDKSSPILAVFVDEDMEHEFVEQKIRNTFSAALADFYLTEKLSLIESYDPSSTDDGNSPLQDDSLWGFCLTLMRGGGADADIQHYSYNYDGFSNSKWRTVAGQYMMSSDTMDNMGNVYDYNGKIDGIGGDERFSLKIRAYKQPSWADEPLCDSDVVDASTGKVTQKIRSRGLFDTFISEYAHFVLNRRKYKIVCKATAAQIADIPNHWQQRYRINGMTGWIDKVSYDISVADGIGDVEITFYAL